MPLDFKWEKCLKPCLLILHWMGLWPNDNEVYGKNKYTMYTIISISVFVCGYNVFHITNIFFIYNNLEQLTESLFVMFSCLSSVFKSFSLILNMSALKEMVIGGSATFQPKTVAQKKMLEESFRFWRRLFFFFNALVGSCAITRLIFPVLDGSYKEFALPFLAWYPFNIKKSANYKLAYFHQGLSIIYMATIITNTDTFVAAFHVYIGTQCDILCDNLRNIGQSEDFDRCLRSCIEHHAEILRFIDNCNRVFNWTFFTQFGDSAISIGLTMFRLTRIVFFTSEFYSDALFGSALMVEIFLYCWFGNEVKEKSGNISYAIYESNWTGTSPQVKKNIIFFMLKSQTPITISAFNLFGLTVSTFVAINRTAWSYFTLLRQVSD